MKTRTLSTLIALILAVTVLGQRIAVNLSFTAINNASCTRLDSIKIMNRTQGGDTVIYYPDTTLTLDITTGDTLLYIGYSKGYPVGIGETKQKMEHFKVFQNYPNPIKDNSTISMYIPKKGTVNVIVADIQGRVVIAIDKQLDKGNHLFRFSPGNANLFFFTVRWNGISRSIKILSTRSNTENRCALDYIGKGVDEPQLEVSPRMAGLTLESGILDTPVTNKNYTFQFATNIPCPGTPAFTYGGQVYNTIQIFSQCWLKENLNIGTMINGVQNQTNNSILEKYCYNNNPDSCTKYGGIYLWDEMMQYVTQQGVQGICPPGWHIPADEEWKVLEGAVDSKYGIGNPMWDYHSHYGYRGYDAGTNLKTTSGWKGIGGGTDLFGFSGLPGGGTEINGAFAEIGYSGYWWSSTEIITTESWSRGMTNYVSGWVYRFDDTKEYGYSVRCVLDY